MKKKIGFGLIALGVIIGLFVGLWLCFIGGIIQAIGGITNPEGIQASAIAIGVARVVLAGFAGWLSAIIFIIPGLTLIESD